MIPFRPFGKLHVAVGSYRRRCLGELIWQWPKGQTVTTKPARKRLGSDPVPNLPIAGIGVSAGGLEGFVQLLKGLPPETGMAFGLVQHREFEHISHATQVPVCAVLITIASARWVFAPRGNSIPPIDCFLRSLAANRGEVAVGVICWEWAPGGTAGVEAVYSQDGFTFAGFRRPII